MKEMIFYYCEACDSYCQEDQLNIEQASTGFDWKVTHSKCGNSTRPVMRDEGNDSKAQEEHYQRIVAEVLPTDREGFMEFMLWCMKNPAKEQAEQLARAEFAENWLGHYIVNNK